MRRRALPSASLALAALASCGGASEPSPASPPPAPPAEATRAPASARFGALRDSVVARFLADEPRLGRSLGLHAHDGRIADYSLPALARRISWLEETERDLAAFEAEAESARLSPDERLDLGILLGQVRLTLFRLRDQALPAKDPRYYEELFAVGDYLDRNYAPFEERAKKLLAHEEAALGEVAHVRRNLVSPLPKRVVETAIKVYDGYASYLRGDVKKLLEGAKDEALRAKLLETNERLAAMAASLSAHLRGSALPAADESHVLGPARFSALLRAQEGLEMPLEAFAEIGEKDLARNKAAYESLLAKGVEPRRPEASELLGEATRLMGASRTFLEEKKLVTIPFEDRTVVKETPPYMRYNQAFLNASGPFEEKPLAFYYVTPPDPSWPKAEREGYLMPRGVLLTTTVHEVYPGHFLQSQWARKAPTVVQKVFSSYSFVEGWAHYVEEMMVEEGFGAEDPETRLGQLGDALLRNCRMVVAVGVHARGMSLEEAERRFREDCHQDAATAREQATRATFDPGYFAYTLGKLQILSLRDEAKKALGPRFSTRAFHDALLAHGAPPVPLLRARVLEELGAR